MLQSEYDVIVRHQRLKLLLIILTAIAVLLVLYVTIKVGKEYLYKPTEMMTGVPPKDADTSHTTFPEPEKIDFGASFPTDFPADIPTEKDAKLTQSYSLDYPEQKQLSIFFDSTKTVKENYALYSDYAKKEGWNILNTEEKSNLSFLYATKESMEMNVTVVESTVTPAGGIPSDADPSQKEKLLPLTKSQVSVSVLRK